MDLKKTIRYTAPANRPAGKRFGSTGLLLAMCLLLNTGLVAGLFIVLLKGKTPAKQTIAAKPAQVISTDTPTAQNEQKDGLAALINGLAEEKNKKETEAVSFQTAQQRYAAGDYRAACRQYYTLMENFTGRTVREECIRDMLQLQTGLCLHRMGQAKPGMQLLGNALQSRSMPVRAMANYHCAIINATQKQFFDARRHAYQTLALLEIIQDQMPPQMEADCCFIAAESVYRQVMNLYNLTDTLPGRDWSDQTAIADLPTTNPAKLEAFLLSGFEKFAPAALGPKVETDPTKNAGSQWTVIAMDAPLEELLWKIAAAGQLSFQWQRQQTQQTVRTRPTTVCLRFVPGQYAAEVIAGAAGLIWRFDGQKATIFDPQIYTDFGQYQNSLTAEGIAIWQRFTLKYRTDRRTANAHYALGQLYRLGGQTAAALGEFKLVVSRFPHNPLAPYALMETGRIKTSLKDYTGAAADLNELLRQYPDCKIADEATLNLADATQENGLNQEAIALFKKVYQMNLTPQGKCRAAYGLAECAYRKSDPTEARQWFQLAIELTENKKDPRLAPAYFKLGKTCVELGQFVEASTALQAALGESITNKEYVQTIVELANAKMKQQDFVKAMQVIETVDESRLNQEDACTILMTKSKLLCEIDAADAAISLLRRRIEFIADSQLRAMLTLELANCYITTGDLTVAQRELNDVLADLGSIGKADQAVLMLAQIAFKQDKPEKARQICLKLLEYKEIASPLRQETANLLGDIYAADRQYDKAALAYAGLTANDRATVQ